jgi:transposase
MEAAQLREVVRSMLAQAKHKDAVIEKLTHENAVLKRLKFAAQSERFNAEQRSLLEEALDADLQAVSEEIERLTPAPGPRRSPASQTQGAAAEPAASRSAPRTREHHVQLRLPDSAHRRGRGREARLCPRGVHGRAPHPRQVGLRRGERLVQAPLAPHILDKGIPTAGLVAQVLVAKYADHLPLYRQETLFERAGLAIARSTLAQWVGSAGVQLQPLVDAMRDDLLKRQVLHADETPVAMLDPGAGKTKRAYLWSYCSTSFDRDRLVVFDFAEGRAGHHAMEFLGHPGEQAWRGALVCDDYDGYKALFAQGITEAGCLAHYLERGLIRCEAGRRQCARGRSEVRAQHKIRSLTRTARTRAGRPWASMAWRSPARCRLASRTPAWRLVSSAGWS